MTKTFSTNEAGVDMLTIEYTSIEYDTGVVSLLQSIAHYCKIPIRFTTFTGGIFGVTHKMEGEVNNVEFLLDKFLKINGQN